MLVDALDVPAAQALQYARSLLPDDLMAMHIDLDPIRTTDLVEAWGRLGYTRFPLEVVDCPDRRSDRTAAEFVARELLGGDTDVTVLIPRRVYQRYWHRLVHDNSANTLAKALSGLPNCTVTFVPYLMGSREGEAALVAPLARRRCPPNGGATAVPTAGSVPADSTAGNGLADVAHREHVRVTGKVRSVKVQPLRGTPTFELTLVDDSGALSVVFFGRRSIAGRRARCDPDRRGSRRRTPGSPRDAQPGVRDRPRLGPPLTTVDHSELVIAMSSGSQTMTIAIVVVVAVLVVNAVCLWRIYRAMGQSAWSGIVPLLNAHVVFQPPRSRMVVGPAARRPVRRVGGGDHLPERPVPLFGRSIGFTVGLVLVPTVFLAILAFGRSTYVGPTERVV